MNVVTLDPLYNRWFRSPVDSHLQAARRKIRDLNGVVSREHLWIPQYVTPIAQLPSYPRLSPTGKIRINHLYALKFCEVAIVLEKWLMDLMRQLDGKSGVTQERAEEFAQEEEDHTTVFWMLLQASVPNRYRNGSGWLVGHSVPFWMTALTRIPFFTLFWTFLALYCEERFLTLNHLISKSESIDPLHRAVHEYHFLEEVRHVSDGEKLWKAAIQGASPFKKWVNASLMRMFFKQAYMRVNDGKKLWGHAQGLSQQDLDTLKVLESELPAFVGSPIHREMMFSKESHPRTTRALSRDPIFNRVLGDLCQT